MMMMMLMMLIMTMMVMVMINNHHHHQPGYSGILTIRLRTPKTMVSKLPIKMIPVASEEQNPRDIERGGRPGPGETILNNFNTHSIHGELCHTWMLWDRIDGGPLLAKKFSDHPGVSQFVINPQHTGSLCGKFLPTLHMLDLLVL